MAPGDPALFTPLCDRLHTEVISAGFYGSCPGRNSSCITHVNMDLKCASDPNGAPALRHPELKLDMPPSCFV